MKIKNIMNNKILKIVLIIILLILIFYNIIYVINGIITQRDYINIFGLEISIANDNTMKDKISKNALVFSIKTDISKVKQDDIITIKNNSLLKYRRVTKITGIDDAMFVVKGDNNYFNDTNYVSKENYEGKYLFSIPIIGIIFKVFQSKIITVVTLFILIYVLYTIKQKNKRRNKTRKIRKNLKREKM